MFFRILFLASFLSFFITACSKHDEKKQEENLATVRVEKIKAQQKQFFVSAQGHTFANRSVTIPAEVIGQVEKIHVKIGDLVKKGDLLITINPEDRFEKVQQAEAYLKQKQIQNRAVKALEKKSFKSELDAAQSFADLKSAEAQFAERKIIFEKTKIRAPFDGIVEAIPVDEGSIVNPMSLSGSDVVTLVELSPMLVEAYISENDLTKVRQAQTATVFLNDGTKHDAKKTFLAKKADLQTRMFRMEFEIDNKDLSIADGLSVSIEIPIQNIAAQKFSPALLSINESNVLGVKVIDAASKVVFVPVEIITIENGYAWVSGLSAEVNLITVGQEFVAVGQKVKPVFVSSKEA